MAKLFRRGRRSRFVRRLRLNRLRLRTQLLLVLLRLQLRLSSAQNAVSCSALAILTAILLCRHQMQKECKLLPRLSIRLAYG